MQLHPSVENALKYAAHNEISALTLVGISEGVTSAGELASYFSDLSGDEITRPAMHNSHVGKLEANGLIDTHATKSADGCRKGLSPASEHGGYPLALAGSVLTWSLEQPPGMTASRMLGRKSGELPTLSINILEALLEGAYLPELDLPGYAHDPSLELVRLLPRSRLRSLTDDGIIESGPDPNRFRILDPEQVVTSRPSTCTKKAHGVLAEALETTDPAHKWTVEELINFAKQNGFISQEETTLFTRFVLKIVSQDHPQVAPGTAEKIALQPKQWRVSEQHKPAAESLVRNVALVSEPANISHRKVMQEAARAVYRNEQLVGALVSKAIQYSATRLGT